MKLFKIITVFLCGCLTVLTMSQSISGETPPDGFKTWDEYYNYLVFGETDDNEITDVHSMKLVSKNNNFAMYYYDKGSDIYIEDLKTGKIWGSALDKDYINTDGMAVTNTSNLMTISYADKNNNVTEVNIISSTSEQSQVVAEYSDDSVNLHITVTDAAISFDTSFTLKSDGIEMEIKNKSIKESGDYRIVSIKALPLFGATKPGENGYVFYPDGSGALMNIGKEKPVEPQFYTYTVYGEDSADFDKLDENDSQDIKNLMLPVYGIKQSSGGVFTEIEEGDGNAVLHMSADNFYQAYFELVYRTDKTVTFAFASKKATVVNKVSQKRSTDDKKLFFHILSGSDNTYSNMAVLYRNSLVERNKLKKQELPFSLSIEMFMGISKKGILGSKIQTVTNFNDANSIVNDLYSNGVENLDLLLKGWCDGGYTTLPTSSTVSSKLGGKSALKSLNDTIQDKKGNLYRTIDLLTGDSKTGDFNPQKYALRDGMDTIISDSITQNKYFLNPVLYMQKAFDSFKKDNTTGYCFDKMGSLVFSDNGKSHETTRDEIIKKQKKVIKSESGVKPVAISGGNSYVFENVSRLYDIPDTDSQYFQTDRTVPFYQMVIHGYISYSSMPANLSYDYNYQKLRFVETGSMPHFLVTEKSPNLLKDTDYDKIFSSEYSVWKDKIISIYKEMNDRIGNSWSYTIDEHSYIENDLVRIKYSDSSVVLINYSNVEKEYNGIKIPAMDYVHVNGGQ